MPVRDAPSRPLTRRQEEVLILLGDGLTFKETGAILGIKERTVKAFALKLRKKFDVPRSRDLAVCSRRYFLGGPLVPKTAKSKAQW